MTTRQDSASDAEGNAPRRHSIITGLVLTTTVAASLAGLAGTASAVGFPGKDNPRCALTVDYTTAEPQTSWVPSDMVAVHIHAHDSDCVGTVGVHVGPSKGFPFLSYADPKAQILGGGVIHGVPRNAAPFEVYWD
jgi:hypothetical protein